MNNIKKIANYLFELNEAKRTPRSGWQKLGVKNPESVAEHMALAGQIAFILAQMEGANAEHAATLALFHDTAEVRTGDKDWVQMIYCDKNEPENNAVKAQIRDLSMGTILEEMYQETKDRKTKEAIIVKDADLLELAIQAKVYENSGYKSAPLFIDGIRDSLSTESAKGLLNAIENSSISDWWMAIPEIHAIAQKKSQKRSI